LHLNTPKMKKHILTLLALAAITVVQLGCSGNKCIDHAGREYKTVQIGDQLWMAENLAYEPPTGKYWAYGNAPNNVAKYGYLYDWETAMKVCPAGWHLPSDDEWTTLIDYLGGKEVAGTKMKSKTGWERNGNGTNESSFSGLPGGGSFSYGTFNNFGEYGFWWSATESGTSYAWTRELDDYSGDAIRGYYDKTFGFSVRCLRDSDSEPASEKKPNVFLRIGAWVDSWDKGEDSGSNEVVIEDAREEESNTKEFKDIQMALLDGTVRKAKIYLDREPDLAEWQFGHDTKHFLIYFNVVTNKGGAPKHLVIFVRSERGEYDRDYFLVEVVHAVSDNQEVCFGIHCLTIKNRKIYTNTIGCGVCED
jgi:uncharacterized protein (TIGR02145 family)